MVSFLALEVNFVMVPVLALFFLYCVPIRAVSATAERITRLVEGYNINGLTVMAAMAIISSFSFLFHLLEWQSKYSTKQHFTDISLQLQHDNKRLRLERNMYIQLATCILCLSVKKCAALLSRQEPHREALAGASRGAAAPVHTKME
ncbi:hypothetical protein, conserved [Leishmania tarentolae]|uniref:Endoplasmic reticulum transmembrane protein n=1 Tax=Leishmania tarentolae TaxID=5689 RepID=A0A640KNJ5_LEITA|nr:hypothetical protein, conserved [Leishmania tarentolae]